MLSESEHIPFQSQISIVYIFQVLSGETVGIEVKRGWVQLHA